MHSDIKLTTLILNGFKSFADKTVFDFHDGMTILVGPNGCGKSNIVDAIKWVLGDQSAKSVRGKEMTDVIFNGSDKRPPMGVAEVSLVFDNKAHRLPIDYDTVMVTRRLFRDGHSEYEINRNTCRLKDVRELFMDTGIGVDAYSIIEQGRVASFIQANAKERRQLFEEASGISRLKARKKEALAKLNRSQQNLERLHDIVDEVSRRLARVKRQAERAQKYQELVNELKEKKIAVSIFDYQKYMQMQEEYEKDLTRWQDELVTIQKEQGSFDAQRFSIDEQLAQANQNVQGHATELVKIDGEIQRLSDLVELHAKQIETTSREKQRRQEHLSELSRRREEMSQESVTLQQQFEGYQEKIEQCERMVKRFEQKVEDQEEVLLQFSSQLESLRSKLAAGEASHHRLIHLIETNQVRLERFNREISEANEKAQQFDRVGDEQKQRARALEARIQDSLYQQDELKLKLKDQELLAQELDTELSHLDEELTEVRLEKSRKMTEKRVLEDLEKQHAGLTEAVKALLHEGRHNAQLLTGLIGLSAELVNAEPSIARAVDAALGAGAQIVIVEDIKTMEQAEKILEEKALGQVAFAPLSDLPPLSLPPIRDDFEHQGRLVDRVRVDPSYRLLFEHLLGVWYLVDESCDLAQVPAGVSVVTASGRRRGPRGTYVLGPAGETTGLVSRRSSLQTIEAKIEELAGQEEKLQVKLHKLSSQQEAHETSRSDLASELMKVESFIADRRSDRHVLDQEMQLLKDRQHRLAERVNGLKNEQQILSDESTEHQRQLTYLKEELPQLNEKISSIKVQQEEANENQQKDREALIAARMDQNSTENEYQRISSSWKHLKEALNDLEEDHLRLGEEDQQASEKISLWQQDTVDSQEKVKEFFGHKEIAENALEQARAERLGIEEKKKEIDETLSGMLPRLRDAQETVSKLQIQLREVVFKKDNLIDRVKEDYDLNLVHTVDSFSDSDEQKHEDFDIEHWRQDCDEIKHKIDSLGSVNLEALQEETELDERHKFLAQQEKDLRQASQKLSEVVSKIDTRARDLFTSTFEAVREHFKVTFRQLFGGGRADLRFEHTEDDDILEAGIEITACPPGKEPRSITLLSGGEKTMTAVALLFAIFKSRPSPFCILDEVDAALDESNIDRWLAMLEHFKDSSQFLVITHNKRTMKDGSMIYGVTMQEPGVSCKLSLKFEDLDENKDISSLPDNKVA